MISVKAVPRALRQLWPTQRTGAVLSLGSIIALTFIIGLFASFMIVLGGTTLWIALSDRKQRDNRLS